MARVRGRFMKEKYTPFLLSAKGKALVLLGTTSLLAAGIYGVTQVRGRSHKTVSLAILSNGWFNAQRTSNTPLEVFINSLSRHLCLYRKRVFACTLFPSSSVFFLYFAQPPKTPPFLSPSQWTTNLYIDYASSLNSTPFHNRESPRTSAVHLYSMSGGRAILDQLRVAAPAFSHHKDND